MEKCRGKMTVQSISDVDHPYQHAGTGEVINSYHTTEVVLAAEYDDSLPEDVRYAKATPSGKIVLTVDNPSAVEFFRKNPKLYVDFSPVPFVPVK